MPFGKSSNFSGAGVPYLQARMRMLDFIRYYRKFLSRLVVLWLCISRNAPVFIILKLMQYTPEEERHFMFIQDDKK